MHSGETHSCRAIPDGYGGCGCPQCTGDTMIVPEADLGLSWEEGGEKQRLRKKKKKENLKICILSVIPDKMHISSQCI